MLASLLDRLSDVAHSCSLEVPRAESGASFAEVVLESRISSVLKRIKARRIQVQSTSTSWGEESLNSYSPFGNVPRAEKAAIVQQAMDDPGMDRAMGCMCGMAVADGLGHMFEFLPAIDAPNPSGPYYDATTDRFWKVKNKFKLKRGQWTDDCSMGLCIADSLVIRRMFDGSDQRIRFWAWWFGGYNNAFRKERARSASVGLGANIARSLYDMRPGATPPPRYESASEDSGNGSVMRLAPIPIFFQSADDVQLGALAAESSYTTHPGIIAAEACRFLAFLLARALALPAAPVPDARAFLDAACSQYLSRLWGSSGWEDDQMKQLVASSPVQETEACWNWRAKPLPIQRTLSARGDRYNGYPVSSGYFGSYAPDALAMALHCVYHNTSFKSTVAHCINLLGDADSTASVAGQIAGALYGYSGIPRRWLTDLEEWDDFEVPLRGVLLKALGSDPNAHPPETDSDSCMDPSVQPSETDSDSSQC